MDICTCRETDKPPRDDLILIYGPQGPLQWWGRKSCPEHGMKVIEENVEPVPEEPTNEA